MEGFEAGKGGESHDRDEENEREISQQHLAGQGQAHAGIGRTGNAVGRSQCSGEAVAVNRMGGYFRFSTRILSAESSGVISITRWPSSATLRGTLRAGSPASTVTARISLPLYSL